MTQPFLKWAGGKGQLLEQYERFFPARRGGDYYEPFLGSGAVFFRLRDRRLFKRFHLSDANPELINCYCMVRDRLDDLINRLREHQTQHTHDYYYTVRDLDRDPNWPHADPIERAARLIYLNKTCYNGLWRVNSQGYFNVPMGRYKKPDILNVGRLCAASAALQDVELTVRDFEAVLDCVTSRDFVYFDPPYVPLSRSANFTSYYADSFTESDQRRLAYIFASLASRGTRVMLSNSDTPLVRLLYTNFQMDLVEARRNINSHSGRRGLIQEIVVLSCRYK